MAKIYRQTEFDLLPWIKIVHSHCDQVFLYSLEGSQCQMKAKEEKKEAKILCANEQHWPRVHRLLFSFYFIFHFFHFRCDYFFPLAIAAAAPLNAIMHNLLKMYLRWLLVMRHTHKLKSIDWIWKGERLTGEEFVANSE